MDTFEIIKKEFLDGKIEPKHWLGDSLTRFDLYQSYAKECESITEFGVFTGSSTVAFLNAHPKKMRGYDITAEHFHLKSRIEKICERENIDYEFIVGHSCRVEIDETDLLFIDSQHTYETFTKELELHNEKVKKYIIAHDTTSFPRVFEGIKDFLENNDNWEIHYRCEIRDGVTVLKRK